VRLLVFLRKNDKPEAIASSIISIDINKKYEFTNIIEKLDVKFVYELKKEFSS
jgi:hypothetical protein